jgi:hypothetical protein
MPYTRKTWSETIDDLEETFARWGVIDWSTTPQRGPRKQYQTLEERRVTVRWTLRGELLVVQLDDYPTAAENLRAIYNSLEALRLIESRGVSAIVRDLLPKLPPPAGSLVPTTSPASAGGSDPYDVLGIARTAPLEVAQAAYRALAKQAAGDEAKLRRLNLAIEGIRKGG